MKQIEYPTLRDLRRSLAAEPVLADWDGLTFDIPGTERPGYLPDAIFVGHDVIDHLLAGGYRDLPDSTPLAEIL
jgi:hypothetical protein